MTIFTCEAARLAKTLRDVRTVCVKRDTMAILGHVLIRAEGDTLHISATDLDMLITRRIPAQIEREGMFTVEAQRFTDVISALADGAQVKLSHADGFVSITAGRAKFRFGTMAGENFPPLPFSDPVARIEEGSKLIPALAKARHAMKTEDTANWHLCGAFMTVHEGFVIVATDGARMAIQRPTLEITDFPSIIVPARTVDQITKLDGFEFEASNDKVRCAFPDGELISKTIDGNFPSRWPDIAPKSVDITARVDGDSIAAALSRVMLVSDDKERTVTLKFDGESLTITNRGNDQGEEVISCEMTGAPIEVRFRSQFLSDAIKAIDADTVIFGMTGERAPVRITADTRPEMTLVVMPMLN